MLVETASLLRSNLFSVLKQIAQAHQIVEIQYKEGNAILLSKEDFEQLQHDATLYRIKQREKTERKIPLEEVYAQISKHLE